MTSSTRNLVRYTPCLFFEGVRYTVDPKVIFCLHFQTEKFTCHEVTAATCRGKLFPLQISSGFDSTCLPGSQPIGDHFLEDHQGMIYHHLDFHYPMCQQIFIGGTSTVGE
jgi:hypothetical protein